MPQNPRDSYLEVEVRTATPQRLRLMLIDGALRFARQSLETWGSGDQSPESYDSLVRCRSIVAELTGSIRDEHALAKQVKDIHLFLYRQLAETPAYNDRERLKSVIEVLEEERETWRLVCEKMPEAPSCGNPALLGCEEIRPPANPPANLAAAAAAPKPVSRLSLEA